MVIYHCQNPNRLGAIRLIEKNRAKIITYKSSNRFLGLGTMDKNAKLQMIYGDLNQFEALFLNHSATCPQAQRRLNWDKRSNNFTLCPVCNEPI